MQSATGCSAHSRFSRSDLQRQGRRKPTSRLVMLLLEKLARSAMPTCLPRWFEIGPAFRDIANTPGMTTTALTAFLTTSHPKMPNLILTPKEMADVTAYILSLRHHR